MSSEGGAGDRETTGCQTNPKSFRRELQKARRREIKLRRREFEDQAKEALKADDQENRSRPAVLILCGIPGSGKTTFAKLLEDKTWFRINQDELGNRPACEKAAEEALLENRNIVIDRCNFNVRQRKTWVELAKARGSDVGTIHFNVPLDVCQERVQSRQGHPMLPANDENALRAVRSMSRSFVAPKRLQESLTFCSIVDAATDTNELVGDGTWQDLRPRLEALPQDNA